MSFQHATGRAGYAEQGRLPIGASCEHGFAVTTRLEQITSDGSPKAAGDRWLSSYPKPASLRWPMGSSEPYLPVPGRYRVLLVAFTDLHVPQRGQPQRWDETTAMEGPGLTAIEFPVGRHATTSYRIGIYVYEYEAHAGAGQFLGLDEAVPAASSHVERSGLSELMITSRFDGPIPEGGVIR